MPERDDEAAKLFREAVRDVKPLAHERRETSRRRATPRARFARAERHAVLDESLQGTAPDPAIASGEELVYRRPGVQDAVLRKLRRGEYRVEGELDLHGLTVVQAKEALRRFLSAALSRDARCVRIIHGKGLRSGHRGPVLKNTVSVILRRTATVLAFVSARQVDGGTGAVYVLLAR